METHTSTGTCSRLAIFSVAALIGVAQLPAAKAEPAPPYRQLLLQAQMAAPRLAESAATVRVSEGLSLQATARPNPALEFEAENFGRFGGSNSVADAQQQTLSVGQLIELGGKHEARILAGEAGVNAAQLRNREVVIDFGYDLALGYAAAEVAQGRVVLFDDALMAAQEDLRAARALVNAGREADVRAVQAEAAVAAAQADLEAARASAQSAFSLLASLAGVPQPYSGVDSSLLPLANNLPLPPAQPPLITPAVAAATAERDAAMRRIAVEQTRAVPDVMASLGVRRLAGDNATAFVGALSVPLPLFDRNRGNIAAALGQRDAAEARLSQARLEAENGYRSAAAQALAANARLAAGTQAELAAEEAYRLARVGYDAGRTPLIELLLARRNLTSAQALELEARLARINAEAALARLLGKIPFGETP
ncbi:MAG TPA: TolC family protein [Micropepsaceae bacterium]|nr:TolC family protein [Micropepsaceae bacterium]